MTFPFAAEPNETVKEISFDGGSLTDLKQNNYEVGKKLTSTFPGHGGTPGFCEFQPDGTGKADELLQVLNFNPVGMTEWNQPVPQIFHALGRLGLYHGLDFRPADQQNFVGVLVFDFLFAV